MTPLKAALVQGISIHAPRTGSDGQRGIMRLVKQISIHAPRTGSDISTSLWRTTARKFQSTLPARGATIGDSDGCGVQTISIHAPRTGSDLLCVQRRLFQHGFQSTLPARGATALRRTASARNDFNPRSPHGERRQLLKRDAQAANISIHAPRTGSDSSALPLCNSCSISIHAPRTGSDRR